VCVWGVIQPLSVGRQRDGALNWNCR
jgi:hypothetical protein